MKRNISREEGQNRESIEKDNLYEVNRYADTAFPVGAYTVTREGIMPEGRGYMLPAVVLKRQYKWQIEILENLTEILSLLEYRTEDKRIEEKKAKYQETEYQIAVKLVSMWQTFIQNVQSEVVKPSRSYIRKQERIQKMLTYIHDNYMNEIHLKEIAEAASVSIGECCRCFQNMVRTTPNQYLTDYRVEKSKELFVGSQMSVTEIAYAVGLMIPVCR